MRTSGGAVLLGIVCPPAYCALHRKWGGCALTGFLCLIALWWAFLAISYGPSPVFIAGPPWLLATGLLWLLATGLALAKATPWVFVSVLVALVLLAVLVTLYQDVGLKARLAADQGTIDALRKAIASYQATRGTFPPDRAAAESLVTTPWMWGCEGQGWSYDPQMGRATLLVNDLRACRGE